MFEETPRLHPAQLTFRAPARVNLLGEHTDYTGGLVLPMAIPFHTIATITPSATNAFTFTSALFPTLRTLHPEDHPEAIQDWSDYPVGVLRELQMLGIDPPPFDLHLSGNVPFGSGLSSSASVEVASCLAMLAFAGSTLPEAEIAVLCRRAENNFVHSPCGIMDQFVITAAHAGHALLLNTRELTVEHLPMNQGSLADTRIVVCNSMVRHSVATGEYGTRRREAEAGQAAILARFPGLRDLGDATLDHLAACREDMSPASFRRCRHLITDNHRVRQARDVLRSGDPVGFGHLMLQGHVSERDDFECSTPEIDFLVETAAQLPGCYGARLTGGGFGGCTVNLVDRAYADTFATALKQAYQQQYNIAAETYLCEAVDGAVALASSSTANH
jgi:galactokinase